MWQTVRHSKYTFISIRRRKSCSFSLSAEGNEKSWASLCSERINLLTALDLCGCLINKAVVYLLTFPHSNCKRVSDVHFLLSFYRETDVSLTAPQKDRPTSKPTFWQDLKRNSSWGSQPKCKEHTFLFLLPHGKTHKFVCMKATLWNQIILTWNTRFVFLSVFKDWGGFS